MTFFICIYFAWNLGGKEKMVWCIVDNIIILCHFYSIKSFRIRSCPNKKLNISFWNVARILLMKTLCMQCLDIFLIFSIQLSIYVWSMKVWILNRFFQCTRWEIIEFSSSNWHPQSATVWQSCSELMRWLSSNNWYWGIS